MNIFEWLTIFSICLIGAATPGPSLIIILYITNTKGLLAGIITSIGHGLGIFIYAIISILSISYLIKISPVTIQIIQLLGALFLIFIGYKIIFFKNIEENNFIKYKTPKSLIESFLIGFTTSFINPKVIIFFSAIFSQFLNQDYSVYTKSGMALLAGGIDTIWYILASFSITTPVIKHYIIVKQKIIFIICGYILVFLSFCLMYQTLKKLFLFFFLN